MSRSSADAPGFSEKDFYLAEFRGRAIGIGLERADARGLEALAAVLAEFASNATRVVILTEDPALLERIVKDAWISSDEFLWASSLWRRLRAEACAGVRIDGGGQGFLGGCREVVDRLQLAKLVLIDEGDELVHPDGSRLSYVDVSELDRMLGDPHAGMTADRVALFREIRGMVLAGIPAVNLCRLEGLAQELFTYAGSGTLVTRERYTVVRPLALDDFDVAHHLIVRGVSEGYLLSRSDTEIDVVLAHAFGVFIENRYLAGLATLIPHPQSAHADAGEVASLYTVTRFLGEGVGGHLLRFARDYAEKRGMPFLFACTTSERVEAFFLRNGYRVVARDAIPDSKWHGYPSERNSEVRCLRLEIPARSGP